MRQILRRRLLSKPESQDFFTCKNRSVDLLLPHADDYLKASAERPMRMVAISGRRGAQECVRFNWLLYGTFAFFVSSPFGLVTVLHAGIGVELAC